MNGSVAHSGNTGPYCDTLMEQASTAGGLRHQTFLILIHAPLPTTAFGMVLEAPQIKN